MSAITVRAAGFLSRSSNVRSFQSLHQFGRRPWSTVDAVCKSLPIALFQSRGGDDNAFTPNGDYNRSGTYFDDDFSNGLPGLMPMPGSSGNTRGKSVPNKGDVYSDDELFNLLKLHEDISDQVQQKQDKPPGSVALPGEEKPEDGMPSLHELVMQTVREVGNEQNEANGNSKQNDNHLQKKVEDIIAIAADIDGTLLSSKHELHPRTERAIRQVVQQISSGDGKVSYFFLATGKSKKGALDILGPEIGKLLNNLPGVFIQGLYCVDGEGNVLFEQKLPEEAIKNAEGLAKKLSITVLGYDGDYLYSNSLGDKVQVNKIHEKWGEPMPKSLDSLTDHDAGFHKLLFMHDDVSMLSQKMRPELEKLAQNNSATVTTAVPTILELLPEGCSKGNGVQKLCEALKIDPSKQLLAIGDAENDAGMLKLAAIGAAVGNACDIAKESADVVMEETSDDGAAGAAMEQYSRMNH